ncbi:MAG TPA: hypothetical protein VJ779_05585 [Acetobacteraceae bacterium]|nr:hypothetical protein [Acetobacteraceae bacterium]
MPDEPQALMERSNALRAQLEAERRRYLRSARTNYYWVQAMSWGSSAAGIAAAVLGLVPLDKVEKWQVGVLAAISTALVTASRQLGLQQKANWHYRKVDRLKGLQRRLLYELPISPTADNLAAISRAWSALDSEMTREWEDMQHEPTTQPKRPATGISGEGAQNS